MVIQYRTWHISRSDVSRNVFICMLLARMRQELGEQSLLGWTLLHTFLKRILSVWHNILEVFFLPLLIFTEQQNK